MLQPPGSKGEDIKEPKIWASLHFSRYGLTPWELEEIGWTRQYNVPCVEQAFDQLEDDYIKAFKRSEGRT